MKRFFRIGDDKSIVTVEDKKIVFDYIS